MCYLGWMYTLPTAQRIQRIKQPLTTLPTATIEARNRQTIPAFLTFPVSHLPEIAGTIPQRRHTAQAPGLFFEGENVFIFGKYPQHTGSCIAAHIYSHKQLEHSSGSPSQNHLQNQSGPGTAEDQKRRSSPSRTLKSTSMADAVYTSVLLSTFQAARKLMLHIRPLQRCTRATQNKTERCSHQSALRLRRLTTQAASEGLIESENRFLLFTITVGVCSFTIAHFF